MSLDDYNKAKKAGEKAYRRAVASGHYPYLPALDEIVTDRNLLTEESVGLCEIPLSLVVGTVTQGRREAFADNFMPLLTQDTEFATKWMILLDHQSMEGIREPIKVLEYMGRFYVEEGNKRVSVLRYLDQPTIMASIKRVLPREINDDEMSSYREFIRFFQVTHTYDLFFSEEESYGKLAGICGCDLEETWPEDTVRSVRSSFFRFSKILFARKGSADIGILPADAFLIYLSVYPMETLMDETDGEIDDRIDKVWDEFRVKAAGDQTAFLETPNLEKKKNIFGNVLKMEKTYSEKKPLKIAFIYDGDPNGSRWIHGHEEGRIRLEERFKGLVATTAYPSCLEAEDFDAAIENAASAKTDLIVTTSPIQMDDAMRAAMNYPSGKFLNCSVHLPHKAVRTYYGRMYEAKFLLGALAATLATDHRVGYVSNYPICGNVSNINAFAIGAAMIDPKIKVYLTWSCLKEQNWHDFHLRKGLTLMSGPDLVRPGKNDPEYGLYGIGPDGEIINYAFPEWHWGKYYELIAKTILNNTWDSEAGRAGDRALNYWWGIAAGVLDVRMTENTPYASRKLIRAMRKSIIAEICHPFEGEMRSQNGVVQGPDGARLEASQIVDMNWLNENIDGTLPSWDELTENAKRAVIANGLPLADDME